MYFVDRDKIESTLVYFESLLVLFEENKDNWDSPMNKLALERITHVMIESVLDVGNSMIDGFIMRDPGSYEDIIDILEDERVLNEEQAKAWKSIISYRKMLVQAYSEVEHGQIINVFTQQLHAVRSFPSDIRTYLKNELGGVVSAFKS